MLNQENDDFPGGLRSGRPMHNSTAHGSAGNNLPDLSSITPHHNTPHHITPHQTPGPFNLTTQSFYESPVGEGEGTRLNNPQQHATPIDYTKEIAFDREYDRLYSLVQTFGLDHAKTECWMETIDEAYMDVFDAVDRFRATLTMNEMDKYLEKVDALDKLASQYKDDLYKRADDERSQPTFSAVNLSTRLSVLEMEDEGEQQQRVLHDQDRTLQSTNSSTPSNDLQGVEVHMNSNNDIEFVHPANIPASIDTPATQALSDVVHTVQVPGVDSGGSLLYPPGTEPDGQQQQLTVQRGGNGPLLGLNHTDELNSGTQGNEQLIRTLKEVVDYAKRNRQLHDNLSAEMISVRNDQTRRIISLEQGLFKANSMHSALASEFKLKIDTANETISNLTTSVGQLSGSLDTLDRNIVRVNSDFTTFATNHSRVMKEVDTKTIDNKDRMGVLTDEISQLRSSMETNSRIITGLRSTLQMEQRKLEDYISKNSPIIGSTARVVGSVMSNPGPRPNYAAPDPQTETCNMDNMTRSDPYRNNGIRNLSSARSMGNIREIDNSAILSQGCIFPQQSVFPGPVQSSQEAPTLLATDELTRGPTPTRRLSTSLPGSPVSHRPGTTQRMVYPPTYVPQVQEQVSGISVVNSSDSTRAFLEHNIHQDAAALRIAVINKLDKYSSEIDIKEAKITGIPEANQLSLQLRSKLDQYIRYPDYNRDLFLTGSSAIDIATEWISNIRILCHELKLSSSIKTTGIGLKIKTFTGDGQQTIFQFLRDCERSYKGKASGEEKAEKIFREHLSPFVQSLTTNLSSDYKRLKEFLIKEYGHYLKVTEALIITVESLGFPARNDSKKRSEYFLKFGSLLEKLQTLPEEDGIDRDKMTEHIRSPAVLNRLAKLLPWEDEQEYVMRLPDDLDATMLTGDIPFDHLVTFVKRKVKAAGRTVTRQPEKPSEKPKGKSVHVSDNPATNTTNAHNPGPAPAPNPHQQHQNQTAYAVQSRNFIPTVTGWADPKLKNPCPMQGHKHEVQECTEFFAKSPYERQQLAKGKMCLTCFGVKEKCNGGGSETCSNLNSAKPILCNECLTFRKDKNIRTSGFNVFFCVKREHNKHTNEQMMAMLKKYAPKVDSEKFTKNVVMSIESVHRVAVNHQSKTRPPSEHPQEVVYDSSSGERSLLDKSLVPTPPNSPAVYIMQWLRIGESNCLCFFDTGANINMIDGAMAEREGVTVISQSVSVLKTVGGKEVTTDYGRYKLNIGPDTEGQSHGLECHGMSDVAGPFEKHSLEAINDELRSHPIYSEMADNSPLPEYVGGTKVNLLLGITLKVLPKYLFTLDSGINVFQSPFTDIFKSNICYAGTHESFGKNQANLSVSHAVSFFNKMEEMKTSLDSATFESNHKHDESLITAMDIDDEYATRDIPISAHFSSMIDQNAHIDFNPSCLSYKDFVDAGAVVCPMGHDEKDNKQHESADISVMHTDCSVHKAHIPIAKLRRIVDEDDTGTLVSYRCPTCAKCLKCKETGKTQAVTLQESAEQVIIENSVSINYEKNKVFVDLPFIKDPVPVLTARHRGPDNYYAARKVYNQQCRKPESHKTEMRKTHTDLLEKKFMKKFGEFEPDIQKFIELAPFRHYYPWKTVEKPDSVSTPCRLVVDPTQSGLNLLLAKGENRLGKMSEILIRNRVKLYSWTSDISKMYNQLQLNKESYPYSLFLFGDALDPVIDPDVYVMTVAWYGVASTGQQAGYAIDQIAHQAQGHDHAKPSLLKDRFVDDVATGAMTQDEREKQIESCRELLASAGFALKFVAKSGEIPCEKASKDRENMKLLGYFWAPEKDMLSPGVAELNFNRKVRGAKKPNPEPIVEKDQAKELMKDLILTRKMITSKVAEFYDPIGIWEPIKLQLKLHLSKLNSLDWDDPITPSDQLFWKEKLLEVLDFPNMTINRCVVPDDADLDTARLIAVSDASTNAGGAAIYLGFLRKNTGKFSNQLLTAKSKLMSATVPRNELSAILLTTELAFIVTRALQGLVKNFVYVTDSTIALAWCHNVNKRLRLYVHSRVESIRRMIEWTTGNDTKVPLYHIESGLNIADLLTKEHDISPAMMGPESDWHRGPSWMSLPEEKMPLLHYEQLTVQKTVESEITSECFQEPFSIHHSLLHEEDDDQGDDEEFIPLDTYIDARLLVQSHVDSIDEVNANTAPENGDFSCLATSAGKAKEIPDFFIDTVYYGWNASLRIMSSVGKFILNSKHKVHITKGISLDPNCEICMHRDSSPAKKSATFEKYAEKMLFIQESNAIRKTSQKETLKKAQEIDRIFYYKGRLDISNQFTTKDLDADVFFDALEFTGFVPLVRASSPLYFAYAMHVHTRLRPHAGVEATVKEISKKMHIIDSGRHVIKAIRNTCTRCRMIAKSTLKLEIAKHHEARTTLAPAFHSAQADIVYGFKGQSYKRSRTTTKVYALVIVCVLTSATSILALEGIELQDVVSAIERHSARYGVPQNLFIDNGTQLAALRDTVMKVRDIDAHLYDSLGITVSVSTPKAHEERGRVENKVKQLRTALKQLSIDTSAPLTVLQWETVFAKIANHLDNIPIAKGNNSNNSDLGFDILTPNRMKLGKNNYRSLNGSIDISNRVLPSDILDRNRKITSTFLQILVDRIHYFNYRPSKWLYSSEIPPKVDDIVLFIMEDGKVSADSDWKLGRIVQVYDRKVRVMYPSKKTPDHIISWKFLDRNWRDVSILVAENELYLNSPDYFDSIKNVKDTQANVKLHE